MTEPYIEFDMAKVQQLKIDYEATLAACRKQFHYNPNSPIQVVEYFKKTFDLRLNNAKLLYIQPFLTRIMDEEIHSLLSEYVAYQKLRFTIINYIDCILRWQENGIVKLRNEGGLLLLPNKRPLPESADITACIVTHNIKEYKHASS